MRAKRSREAGVSLIEIIFALAIIAVSCVAIVSALIQSIRMKDALREQQIAKQAAQKKVEEIKSKSFNTIFTTYNNQQFPVQGIPPSSSGPQGRVTIDNSNPNLLDVTVTVSWRGINGNSSYFERTLYTR